MLTVAFLSLVAGLFAAAEGAPHERRDSAPSGFVLTSPVPPTDILPFRLALTPQDFSGLEQALYSVSTPGDAQYGKHLSLEEVQKFTTPTSATMDAITSFLSAHNLTQTRLSNGKNWLNVNITAGDANTLFGANYSVFTHQETGEKVIRTLEYSIPQGLEGHVQVVHPGTTFPQHIKRSKPKAIPSPPPTATSNHSTRASLPSSCNENMTPACLLELYSIPTALAPSKDSRLVVTSYEEEYVSTSALKKFLQQYRTDLDPSTTFTLQTVAGGQNPQDPNEIGSEGTLDIQMTVGLASGIPVTLLATGESNLLDPIGFINSMDALLAESNPPQVVTISYGWDEDFISPALASTICNSFAQVGARGVSVLVASGDGGVSGGHDDDSCTSSDPFIPVFPGTCPFVTAVGSTIYNNETAAYFSSGGFSNFFATPSYQSSSPYVTNYLKTLGSTYKGRYNASGRAFPDVATIGDYVAIVYQGSDQQEAGTSCSAPMFASVVALLNSELLAAGKSVLGFLNPLLWSGKFDGALNDVTTGSNPGCGSNGFSASAGWDPVTGFGTPNYPKMKAALGL
ncbi:family S53 protease [Dentipellis sp. KUC8613]|nr:family S53 protease [Dentipellis sp. KUC8613]